MNDIQPVTLKVPKEVAKRAGSSERQVILAVRSGELPSLKFGNQRVCRVEAIDQWVKSLETRGIPKRVVKESLARLKGLRAYTAKRRAK